MAKLVLHPETQSSIEQYVARPAHALMLISPPGSGKLSVARYIAAQVLRTTPEDLDNYPYFLAIAPQDGKAIPIETIRELQHFTALKIPGGKTTGAGAINRVVIIESAHLMTAEAQNAILKSLEEPPLDTVFILTAPSADALLPTIRSRVRITRVIIPPLNTLKEHLLQNFAESDIDKALLLSGGMPGLTWALLTSPEEHPLYEATLQARSLLQSTAYERLLLVDGLTKQKQLCQDITFILGQMSRMALTRSQPETAKRWQTIMKAAYAAQKSLQHNTQTKLVLMNLMLEM